MDVKKAIDIIWEEKDNLPDWKILGSSITRLPVMFWEEQMFFFGAQDKKLKKITSIFPYKLHKKKNTHPIFILKKIANFGFKVCPCSSKNFMKDVRYIKEGCVLEITGHKMDRNSYILDFLHFNLPYNNNWNKELRFVGKVPLECINRKGAYAPLNPQNKENK